MSFTLNTGAKIPAIGLGTWQSKPNEVREAVKFALQHGYRHIDCAFMYQNEHEVGQGIRESGVPREEIFVTTKLWSSFHSRPEEALDLSLKNLGLDYVDLYLMHWPVSLNPASGEYIPLRPDGSRDIDENWDFCKTWELMEKLPKSKTRAIGVSNFSTEQLSTLLASAKIVPACNQVEAHPFLKQTKLKPFCDKHGILLEAYSPLGSTNSTLYDNETLKSIAAKHNVPASEIILSWGIAKGWVVLPKSVTPARIESNLKTTKLTAEDVAAIDAIPTKQRFVVPKWGVPLFHDGDD